MSNLLLLHDAGAALYGPRWQSDLARAIGVSDRTMRRWAAGDGAPPAGVWADIHRLLAERQAVIGELLPQLALTNEGTSVSTYYGVSRARRAPRPGADRAPDPR